MMNKFLVFSHQFLEKIRSVVAAYSLKTKNAPARRSLGAGGKLKTSSGFTLVETLAAVVLLTVSITAPMLLTVRSLSSAYYAKDQFTASYLAQEAIEAIHQIRDNQILLIAKSNAGSTDLFPFAIDATCGTAPTYFTVDARHTDPVQVVKTGGAIGACSYDLNPATCPSLQTNGGLYGYGSGWTTTNFTRYVNACYIAGSNQTEVRISATVKWKTASFAERSFTISENMYRWIQDGSGI